MAKRMNKVASVINRNLPESDTVFLIGHPCGFIAPGNWLKSRPKLSIAVGDYLLNDASMSGDFESMLCTLILCGGQVSRKVRRHIKHWHSMGCPHWLGEQRTYLLNSWMNTHGWALFTNAPTDVRDYYRDVAAQGLVWLEEQPALVLEVEGELCENMSFKEMMDFADSLAGTGASFRLIPKE